MEFLLHIFVIRDFSAFLTDKVFVCRADAIIKLYSEI